MIKQSIMDKLERLSDRYQELSRLLGDGEVIADQNRFRAYGREYAEIEPVVECFDRYRKLEATILELEALSNDSDPDLRQMAAEEVHAGRQGQSQLELELQRLLLPRDERDGSDVFLEIRAGTGGDEAAIFAGDLFRMYARYAEKAGWKMEVVSERPGEHGGFREIIAGVSGKDVYACLKFESGAHRVQRVPETESQGRIHTSACTVAILPQVDEIEGVEINKADLRVDTYRASGAGGQHVNRTDSAIRITHLPSGIVVECQDERSQHKNRARAMAVLQARLLHKARSEQEQQQASERRSLVGSGDRSERIRTYNFPQGRVTDHRINLTLYKLAEIMEGELGVLLEALINEYQAELLAALAD